MANRQHLDDMPHTVYRYYDADDEMLYVGCTSQLAKREITHSRTRAWFSEVVRRETETFRDRAAGLIAEQAYIERYKPRHNVQRNGWPERSSDSSFAESMEIARNPDQIVAIILKYDALRAIQVQQAEIAAEVEYKIIKRTIRRLAESKARAAFDQKRAS